MTQTILQIMDSREKEVRRAIADLKEKQLVPLEVELAQIVVARSAIADVNTALGDDSNADLFETESEADKYMRMTYQELAVEALQGMLTQEATIGELLAYIRKNFNREISQGSFSPVLSRMKEKNLLEKKGKTWILPDEDDPLHGL